MPPAIGDIGAMATSVVPQLKIVGLFIVAIVILAGIAWFAFMYFQYNMTVMILSRRGNVLKIYFDKGFYNDRKHKLKLLWSNKSTVVPDYKYLLPAKGGSFITLFQLSDADFVPVELAMPELKEDEKSAKIDIKTIPSDLKLFATLMMQENRLTYSQDPWYEKYFPYMVFAMVAICCCLLIYITLDGLTSFIPAAEKMMIGMKEVAQACRGTAPF